MGKEGELWDDSALIKAFDHAISKNKMIHGKSGEKAINNTEENLPGIEFGSNTEFLVDGLETTTKVMETAESLMSTENSPLELGSSVICVGFSDIQERHVPPTNDISATTSVSQGEHADLKYQYEATCYLDDGSEEYNKLLNRYYEVENQRQHILQQLNQYSNWNHQYPFSSISTTEEYQASVPQPYETVACNCPYGCQNWVVPCNSSPAACSGTKYIDTTCHAKGSLKGNSGPKKVPDFVNTAMAAAEKAHSVTKEANRGQSPECKSATDLDVVLSAWYTAGFYTGKYISEQSSEGEVNKV